MFVANEQAELCETVWLRAELLAVNPSVNLEWQRQREEINKKQGPVDKNIVASLIFVQYKRWSISHLYIMATNSFILKTRLTKENPFNISCGIRIYCSSE